MGGNLRSPGGGVNPLAFFFLGKPRFPSRFRSARGWSGVNPGVGPVGDSAASCARVSLLVDLAQPLDGHVGVDLGGGQVRVP